MARLPSQPFSSSAASEECLGGDAFTVGDTTKAINGGKTSKGVFLFGFGVVY